MEVWKDIPGYERMYQVSIYGGVRRLPRRITFGKGRSRFIYGRRLCQGQARNGYKVVRLCKDGQQTTRYVHRLVLESFVGKPTNGAECCHIDGNRSNNCLSNLQWGTHSNNMLDKTRHGRSQTSKRKVQCSNGRVFESVTQAGLLMGIHGSNISAVCRGKRKTAGGFGWVYRKDQ